MVLFISKRSQNAVPIASRSSRPQPDIDMSVCRDERPFGPGISARIIWKIDSPSPVHGCGWANEGCRPGGCLFLEEVEARESEIPFCSDTYFECGSQDPQRFRKELAAAVESSRGARPATPPGVAALASAPESVGRMGDYAIFSSSTTSASMIGSSLGLPSSARSPGSGGTPRSPPEVPWLACAFSEAAL